MFLAPSVGPGDEQSTVAPVDDVKHTASSARPAWAPEASQQPADSSHKGDLGVKRSKTLVFQDMNDYRY